MGFREFAKLRIQGTNGIDYSKIKLGNLMVRQLACFQESFDTKVEEIDYQWVKIKAPHGLELTRKAEIVLAVKKVVGKQDCVGSFTTMGVKFKGSFLVKRGTVNFSQVEKDYSGDVVFVELDPVNDPVRAKRCMKRWPKGDQYILF